MTEYIVEVNGPMPNAIYERETTEIVRCRDCAFFKTDEIGDYCTLLDFEYVKRMGDGFCAWGERRSE